MESFYLNEREGAASLFAVSPAAFLGLDGHSSLSSSTVDQIGASTLAPTTLQVPTPSSSSAALQPPVAQHIRSSQLDQWPAMRKGDTLRKIRFRDGRWEVISEYTDTHGRPRTRSRRYGSVGQGRYLVRAQKSLGSGATGVVVEGYDTGRDPNGPWRPVALKFNTGVFDGENLTAATRLRTHRRYAKDNADEARTLRTVSGWLLLKPFVPHFIDEFYLRPDCDTARVRDMAPIEGPDTTHCLVMEKLGPSLASTVYMRKRANKNMPFTLEELRFVGRQLLYFVDTMASARKIHADLKPANILHVGGDSAPFSIKVADFGLAQNWPERGLRVPLLQTLWYRAPETVLQHSLTPAIDVWSVGCILFELFSGLPLFPCGHPQELLALQMSVCGEFSPTMISKSSRKAKSAYFRWNRRKRKYVPVKSVRDRCEPNVGLNGVLEPFKRFRTAPHWPEQETLQFYDLLRKILTIDPEKRLDAGKALQHPLFLQKEYSLF